MTFQTFKEQLVIVRKAHSRMMYLKYDKFSCKTAASSCSQEVGTAALTARGSLPDVSGTKNLI